MQFCLSHNRIFLPWVMPMMVGVPELPLGSGLISGLTPSGLISGLTPFVCRLEPPPVGSSTNWEKSMGKGTSACPLGFPALNVVIKFFSWVIFRDLNARKCGQHQSIKTLCYWSVRDHQNSPENSSFSGNQTNQTQSSESLCCANWSIKVKRENSDHTCWSTLLWRLFFSLVRRVMVSWA